MKRLILLFAVLATYIFAGAQTFHAIVFCNTIDRSIGQSMSVELANVSRHFGVLQNLLDDDYLFIITSIDGSRCTASNIQSIINEMNVGPDDVVFTFYGGHGSHAPNNANDPWPQYCMNTGDQSKWLPMALVDKWVAQKNPRLRITMANCCNVAQEGVTIKPMWANDSRATKLDGYDAAAFRKLFGYKGSVMVTSSKLGQYSWCNPYGGMFTNQFWASMDKIGRGNINPDWNSLMTSAGKEISVNTDRGVVPQTPYYKINIQSGNGGNGGGNARRDNNRPHDNSLSDMLARLLDKSVAQDTRLALIPDILSKFFNSSSKVITVASDMSTMVDYEDASDFLHRICLSPYISGISLLNDDKQNLKVHELR